MINNFSFIPLLLVLSFSSIIWPIIFNEESDFSKKSNFSKKSDFSKKSNFHRSDIVTICAGLHLILIFYVAIYALFNFSLTSTIEFKIRYDYVFLLKMSKMGSVFISLITTLWPVSYLYSYLYLESANKSYDKKNSKRFLIFLNLSFFISICLGLAGNLLTMFIFYELLTLSTIPLIAHSYSISVNKALKKYIIYLLGSSLLFFLPAVIYITSNARGGSFSYDGFLAHYPFSSFELMILLLMFLFGSAKASMFPFHGWLPSAMEANYPTSGVLHGALVVNSGIYAVLKVIYEVFGHPIVIEIIREYSFIIYMPISGIIYAGLMSISERSTKKILAWSTVSYLNLIILIAISPRLKWESSLFFALIIHSFTKIALFFIFGVIYLKTGATKLSDLASTYKVLPFTYLAFLFSGLNFSGLHILHFSDWKDLIVHRILLKNDNKVAFMLLLSSFFSIVSLGRIFIEMSRPKENISVVKLSQTKIDSPLSYGIVFSAIFASILSCMVSFYAGSIYEFLSTLMG